MTRCLKWKQKAISDPYSGQIHGWVINIFNHASINTTRKKRCFAIGFVTHHIYNAIHCNSIVIMLKSLIFNYYTIPLQLQPQRHVDVINFHPSIKTWHMALWRFWIIFLRYWFPLPIMIVDGSILWLIKICHMAY